mgnify:CR=1 FL=1
MWITRTADHQWWRGKCLSGGAGYGASAREQAWCRGQNVISVQNFNDIMSQMDQILSYITIFVVFVAAIPCWWVVSALWTLCWYPWQSVPERSVSGNLWEPGRIHPVTVSVGIRHHYPAGRPDRYSDRCGRSLRNLQPDWIYRKGECGYGAGSQYVLLGCRYFLWNLSGEKGSEIKPYRSITAWIICDKS